MIPMDSAIHLIIYIFPFHLEDILRCTASPHAAPNERVMPALIRSGRRISAVLRLSLACVCEQPIGEQNRRSARAETEITQQIDKRA